MWLYEALLIDRAQPHITVRMHQSDREICLLVQDNGTGFDPDSRRAGGHGHQ